MKHLRLVAAALAAALLSGCAVSYSVTPLSSGEQTVRYDRGTPTLFDDKEKGSVQITPLGVAPDGRLVFGMAIFNKGAAASNFGIENLTSMDASKLALKVYSKDELEHEARVRAQWQAFAAVLAGAAGAYAAQQNAYSTTNATLFTPRGGVATLTATTYDPAAAAIGTAAAAAATGYTLNSIRNSMDDTLAHLNGSMLQMTTIDPGRSYGGEVVVDMPKGRDYPKQFSVETNWNGEAYSFDFSVSQKK
jgi:hypothetical protein